MEQISKQRTKLTLAWDHQNLALEAEEIADEWGYMKKYLDLLFPATRASQILRVYSQPSVQRLFRGEPMPTVKEMFEVQKFEVFEGYFDADSQLIQDSWKLCSMSPQKTIFILVSKDGHYTEFLRDLSKIGVEVYIWSDEDEISEKLKTSINNANLIPWDRPYIVVECVQVIKELKGRTITRSNFGQLCREKLQENDIYPQDVGFSHRNPYGSLLIWLEKQGIVEVKTIKESDLISIRIKRNFT